MISSSPQIHIYNRCATANIASDFWPVIESTIAGAIQIAEDRIDEIRLQGSIARGDARVGHSDLDIMVLLTSSLADEEERWIALVSHLNHTFPVVSRVDLEAKLRYDLVPFQQFVLSSDSLNVYGRDRLTKPHQAMDRIELARLVTPNPAEMLTNYWAWTTGLDATSDPDEVRFASRIVGKDFLKVLRGLVLVRGGPYEIAISGMADQVPEWAPEFAMVANDLLALYDVPTDDPQLVRAAMEGLRAAAVVSSVVTSLGFPL